MFGEDLDPFRFSKVGSATLIIDSRTNSHRTFDYHKCLKCKVTIKMVKLSINFGKNLWCTFTQVLNEKSIIF